MVSKIGRRKTENELGSSVCSKIVVKIFKTRYLDYYIIEDNKDIKQTSEEIPTTALFRKSILLFAASIAKITVK